MRLDLSDGRSWPESIRIPPGFEPVKSKDTRLFVDTYLSLFLAPGPIVVWYIICLLMDVPPWMHPADIAIGTSATLGLVSRIFLGGWIWGFYSKWGEPYINQYKQRWKKMSQAERDEVCVGGFSSL